MGYTTEYNLTLTKRKSISVKATMNQGTLKRDYSLSSFDGTCVISLSLTEEEIENLTQGLLLILGMTAVRTK